MDEEQSEADVSGIFTYADGNSSMGAARNGNRPDESIDIVANYPSLDDDDSVIISEDDMTSGASSGVYAKQNDPSRRVAVSGSAKTNFGKLYDIENSVSDGNTNEIMGEYGTKDNLSRKSLLDNKDGKKSPYYDQPIKMMPTGDSSHDKSTSRQTKAIFFNGNSPPSRFESEEEEPSKLCGMPVSRVIMISACFVVIALIVVVVSVVVTSQSDDGGSTQGTQLEDQPNFPDFVTPSPSPSPVETAPVFPPTSAGSDCLPDDDDTTFTVADVEVNCMWLRDKDDLFIKVVCDETEGVDLICSTTCVCGSTEAPTFAPTFAPTSAPTSAPSVSPTTAEPTTSSPTPLDFTQFPTSPTDPPTMSPTAAPTTPPTNEPTAIPTEQPTSQPTRAPTHRPTEQPTSQPTGTPTLAPNSPTSSPTISQAPTIFTTPAPTIFVTRPITNVPTSAPTISVDCEDDLPGTIPSSPSFWTCSWLAQTNAGFRRSQCDEGDPAFEHCPTTCRSCAP